MAEKAKTTHIYDSSGQIDSTGSANAYVIRVSEQISAYHRGMPPIRFKANFGNSGSATANIATELSPSGLGAVTMKKGGGASDLASGDIVSGGVYTLIYDGTFFQVLEQNATAFSLADDAVTNAKLANMAEATIKGRAVGAGTGDPQDLTATQATAILNAFTDALKGLVPASGGGTANFLRADATWASPGSGLTLLTSGTVSSAATLDIVLTSYTSYRALRILLSAFVPATDDRELWARFSTDGGSSYDATGYSYAVMGLDNAGNARNASSGAGNQIIIAGDATNLAGTSNVAARGGADVEITIHDQSDTARWTGIRYSVRHAIAAARTVVQNGAASRETAQDTNAIRFLFESGNITSGKYAVYGLA